MKIDLTKIDQTQFRMDLHTLPSGEACWLVQPVHIGVKWTQENKIFRSSVWDMDGNPISLSFFKFTNWGENPEHFPTPENLNNCEALAKIDGSLLIVSKYKGKFILRTRGTVDASKMENGEEIELFKTQHKEIFNFQPHYESWPFSILLEWTSPLNRIVIHYGDTPQWTLVGVVSHEDYMLWNQDWLDTLAKGWGVQRPERYSFSSISDMIDLVAKWKGVEGICLYSNKGQTIHKIKSDDYLVKHRLKEEFASFEKVLDFYISECCPEYQAFYDRVAGIVDFETANEIRGDISRCVDASKEVQQIVKAMNRFVAENLLVLGDPKDKKIRGRMAGLVIQSYGNTNRASFMFKILDGKTLDADDYKKLFYQVLKK